MLRAGEDRRCLAGLDGAAGEHHHHSIGDLGHHAHVVGDEEDRHAFLCLQGLDQVEDLGLDRDVERRRGLVCNQELRPAGERHGDHHALAHAARKSVRIIVDARAGGRDPNPVEQPQRFGLGLGPGELAVQHQSLGDLEADRQDRVQARHRLLEHHGNVVAPYPAHLGLGDLKDVPTVQQHATADAARIPRREPQDRQGADALAGAGFADQRHRLARRHRERDAVHNLVPRAIAAERGGEVLDVEDRNGHAGPLSILDRGTRSPPPLCFARSPFSASRGRIDPPLPAEEDRAKRSGGDIDVLRRRGVRRAHRADRRR